MAYNEMTEKCIWMTVLYDTVAEQGTWIYVKMTDLDIETIMKQGTYRCDTEEEQCTWIEDKKGTRHVHYFNVEQYGK